MVVIKVVIFAADILAGDKIHVLQIMSMLCGSSGANNLSVAPKVPHMLGYFGQMSVICDTNMPRWGGYEPNGCANLRPRA